MNKELYILIGKFLDITWYSVVTAILVSLLSVLSNNILVRNLNEKDYENKVKNINTIKLSFTTILEIGIFSFIVYLLAWIFKKIPNPLILKKYYISNLKGESNWGITVGFILTIGRSNPYLEININELKTRFENYIKLKKKMKLY